jgi:hypothetical protein
LRENLTNVKFWSCAGALALPAIAASTLAACATISGLDQIQEQARATDSPADSTSDSAGPPPPEVDGNGGAEQGIAVQERESATANGTDATEATCHYEEEETETGDGARVGSEDGDGEAAAGERTEAGDEAAAEEAGPEDVGEAGRNAWGDGAADATRDAHPLPDCSVPYGRSRCVSLIPGDRVSKGAHNWRCSVLDCMNCAGTASCEPGASGCPWGVVWKDEGPCQ